MSKPAVDALAKNVLDFWFSPSTEPYWFVKSKDFDNRLTDKFLTTLEQTKRGELAHWRTTLEGRLAQIIVLDQFSRNIYRDTPDAFAQDGMALILAQDIWMQLGTQADVGKLTEPQRNFALMPFMHSESAEIHAQAVNLFEKYASQHTLDFELKHKAIIDKFGRYPHRNAILGRASTPEEIAFLQQPNSSF